MAVHSRGATLEDSRRGRIDQDRRESEPRRLSKEDFQDLAKVGGDFLKRTVSSSFDVIKEVTGELPKEATQFLAARKEDVLKGLSKEFAQSMVTFTVDKVFAAIRSHKLEVSVSIRKVDEPQQQSPQQTQHQSQSQSKPQPPRHRDRGRKEPAS